jgi:hypothetical protein
MHGHRSLDGLHMYRVNGLLFGATIEGNCWWLRILCSSNSDVTTHNAWREFVLGFCVLNRVFRSYKREKPTNTLSNHSVYELCMVAPTCFGLSLPSSGRIPSAFWELLIWGAVDRMLWMGVLCLVTWCVAISNHHALRTAPHLNISQKTLGTLPEDGIVMPKHVGAPIHN